MMTQPYYEKDYPYYDSPATAFILYAAWQSAADKNY